MEESNANPNRRYEMYHVFVDSFLRRTFLHIIFSAMKLSLLWSSPHLFLVNNFKPYVTHFCALSTLLFSSSLLYYAGQKRWEKIERRGNKWVWKWEEILYTRKWRIQFWLNLYKRVYHFLPFFPFYSANYIIIEQVN
jgi:hypothetical protein